MGTLFVDKLDPQSGTSLEIGSSGDTISVPTGATLTVPNGGLSGQNYPAFAASVTSDQSISSGTWTKIQFDNEILDTNNAYDPTTNYRFTVPTGQAGKYYVCLDYVSCSDSNNLTYSILGIRKNGTIFKRSDMNTNSTANAQFRRFQVNSSTIADLDAGDYIEAFAYILATSPFIDGDDIETRSFFGAYRIGA